MTTWIIPSNNSKFDLDKCLEENLFVDWRQKKNKFAAGDIVYFYSAGPDHRIKFKGHVTEAYLTADRIFDDRRYWRNLEAKNDDNTYWVRIKLAAISQDNSLTLQDLREYGIKSSMQSPFRIESQPLIDFIEKHMQFSEGEYPDYGDADDIMTEGGKKRIYIDVYERNPFARKACIAHYGPVCYVCGIDFGSYYGDFAAGFIHVHHIVPIHTYETEHDVDPIKDLIPVCPNCHAMLHKRLDDGTYYEPDALKRLLESKRRG